MTRSKIYVTRPHLPSLEEFLPYLEEIWRNRWLTNAGPFHERLEAELASHLGVRKIALVSNGTIALMVALQALRIAGQVITTPYSFVATAHSLLWNNLTPVFVDIDPETCNLDPSKIEAAITPQTSAIMPVHCYGTPCDVERIDRIASIYDLKVVYDAAHAFDVLRKDETILNSGDLSVLSFHATKVFNTFEGGAIVCRNAQMKQRINFLKNFGFADEETVTAAGLNGKMNEFQAALGLVQLKHVAEAVAARKAVAELYWGRLKQVPGITCLVPDAAVTPNYAYLPILVGPEYGLTRDALYQELRKYGIIARRYFYPLITDMPMYRGLPSAAPANLPVANRIASEVLCLPIYPDLAHEHVERIVELICKSGR